MSNENIIEGVLSMNDNLQTVFQSNELVQKAVKDNRTDKQKRADNEPNIKKGDKKNSLTVAEKLKMEAAYMYLAEKKLVLWMMSKIQPDDTEFGIMKFQIKDFIKLFNTQKGGQQYKDIHQAIKFLMKRTFAIETSPGVHRYLRWLASGTIIDENTGTVYVKFDDCLKPYLLNLGTSKGRFTAFQLGYIASMNKVYSIRLYEYLKSFEGMNAGYRITIQQFIDRIAEGSYTRPIDLEKWIIQPAIKEINEKTDITVSYAKQRASDKPKSKITHFYFIIKPKTEEEKQDIMYRTFGIPKADVLMMSDGEEIVLPKRKPITTYQDLSKIKSGEGVEDVLTITEECEELPF